MCLRSLQGLCTRCLRASFIRPVQGSCSALDKTGNRCKYLKTEVGFSFFSAAARRNASRGVYAMSRGTHFEMPLREETRFARFAGNRFLCRRLRRWTHGNRSRFVWIIDDDTGWQLDATGRARLWLINLHNAVRCGADGVKINNAFRARIYHRDDTGMIKGWERMRDGCNGKWIKECG